MTIDKEDGDVNAPTNSTTYWSLPDDPQQSPWDLDKLSGVKGARN